MKISSLLSRRNEPASTDDGNPTTYDSNGDGRVDGRDASVETATHSREAPVLTDSDGEQATYRSNSTATDDERDIDAERRAAERAAVARAATARPIDGDTHRPADTTPAAPGGTTAEPAPTGERAGTATTGTTTADERAGDLSSGPAAGQRADRDRTVEGPAPADRTETDRTETDRTETNRTETDGETRPEPEPVVVGPKPRASLTATLGLVVAVAGALAVLTGTLAGYGIAVGALGAVLSVFGLLATRRRHIAGKTDALLGMAFGIAAVVLGVLAMTGQFDWPTTDGDWVQRFREWLDSQFADRF